MQTFFESLTEEAQKKFRNIAMNFNLDWKPIFSPYPKNKLKMESQEEIAKIMSQPRASKKELDEQI